MAKTLKDFLDENKAAVEWGIGVLGAYCQVAFLEAGVGALVCEGSYSNYSTTVQFQHRGTMPETIYSRFLDPNEVEVVLEFPLALRLKKEHCVGGFDIKPNNTIEYKKGEKHLRIAGLS